MDLSYDEVLRRIEEYKKTEPFKRNYCTEKSYPYILMVSMGEGKIVINPLTTCIFEYERYMAWYAEIFDLNDYAAIGRKIKEAIKHIIDSPVDARNMQEVMDDLYFHKVSRYKDYKNFYMHYLLCQIDYSENGELELARSSYLKKNQKIYDHHVYTSEEDKILSIDMPDEEIGKAVIACFDGMKRDMMFSRESDNDIKRNTFETLSNLTISYAVPGDEYTDEGDYGAAECYQGYSYTKDGGEESVADMYFGIAAELDCDMSEENVKAVFEKEYGAVEEFSYKEVRHDIFTHRVEIKNKKICHILYLKKCDENELFSCELVMKVKPAGKRLYKKILNDFEELAGGCFVEK